MASYAASSKSKLHKKPILRKFTQSEKNSLDLDRPATEQGLGIYSSDYVNPSRSVHDVSFNHARRGHGRSMSGASQFSTATNGSGARTGSFVHPFQQTPRPYTPPLAQSYQGSLLESDYSRDSPALPEDEEELPRHTMRSTSILSNRTTSLTPTINTNLPPLRLQTKSASSSRLGNANSQSNLHSSMSVFTHDLTSPADTVSPSSAIRSSMEKGFRIRSRSEVDTYVRGETIEDARRKFREREQAKSEKAAQEEMKALEKRNLKEARRAEKGACRPTSHDGTRSKRSKSDLTATNLEKADTFVGRDYDSAPLQAPPATAADYGFDPPQRSRTAAFTTRKKTHSAWTQFMMWLRTRFLRMGRKSNTE